VTGIYVPWLVDAARLTGYPVVEVNGWKTRGHGGFRALEGVVGHHTADGPGEYPSLNIVTRGRADLAGPLCNYGLGRSGTVYVVAAGVAWHAGASAWAGFRDLNDEFLGIEAESKGTVDDWTPAQRDAYPRLVAAALFYMKRDASRFCGHKECALPKGRKIDPAFVDLNAFRAQVGRLLADPVHLIPKGSPTPAPKPPQEDDDMFTDDDRKVLLENNRILRDLWQQTAGPGAEPGKFTGWPRFTPADVTARVGKPLTPVDYLRVADEQATEARP
jgi:hypothetical protein